MIEHCATKFLIKPYQKIEYSVRLYAENISLTVIICESINLIFEACLDEMQLLRILRPFFMIKVLKSLKWPPLKASSFEQITFTTE